MSSRSSWTINGKHFARTNTERGGLRFFIDGKPITHDEWEQARIRALNLESGRASLEEAAADPRRLCGSR